MLKQCAVVRKKLEVPFANSDVVVMGLR